MANIGFIGVGNMGGALARAVCKAVDARSVYVADFMPEKAIALATECGCTVADNETLVKSCEYIFLGVKPQMLPALLEEISAPLRENPCAVLVSMAAGVTTDGIEKIVGRVPVIRIMPNTPVSVGEGMILYAVNGAVTAAEEDTFKAAMTEAGTLDKLSEELIDAGCAVSGCGPAFVYMFIDALAKGGEAAGLNRGRALAYAAQTVVGAARLLMTSEREPDELKEAVCSPAGSTIEGVKTLEKLDFYDVVGQAVHASFERTKQLGRS